MARARNWRVYVEGIDELIRDFKNTETQVEAILSEASNAGAEKVLATAKATAPTSTGFLKSKIGIKKENSKKKTKASHRIVINGVRYSFAVEGGTKYMPANPFMRNALDSNKNNVKTIIMNKIGNAIENGLN